jgi:phosphatidylethanolamine-binding protein (PEBP) family uncharacterized protein
MRISIYWTYGTNGGTLTAMANSHTAHRPGPDPYAYLPQVPSFELTSISVTDGQPLPLERLSGLLGVPGGQDISPQLSWAGFPADIPAATISTSPDNPTW